MGTIEEIIKTIDNELIEKKKGYLLLGQANDLLVSKNMMSISERSNQKFKRILEENKMSHAYQTESKPRQWRIPLSEEGKKIEKSIKKKIRKEIGTKSNSYNLNQQNVSYTICPLCGINLCVPNEIAKEANIKCLNCKNDIQNPLVFGNRFNNTNNFNLSEIEHQKNEFLKYALFASIGIGFFFPPIWIGTVILFFIRILRVK